MREFNAEVIAEFRSNQGRVSGVLADTPILLLHHIGAKSKTQRVTPLAYNPQRDGSLVIVASNGGSPEHPAWYYNLIANPRIEVEVGTARFAARASELDGTARADLWSKLLEAAPSIGEFQAQTTRQIPSFLLSREDQTARSLEECVIGRESPALPPSRTPARDADSPESAEADRPFGSPK